MTGTARIARALSAAALGFGLLAVAAPTAGADKADRAERTERAERAERAEHVFDCDGSSSSEQAWKTPDQTDGDHPSSQEDQGLDEAGDSGTQGKSDSDPDGDSNGGADKPDCTGVFDDHDQDGNNGCGNDHDFADDNNGNCGGQAEDEAADTDSPDVRAQAAGAVTPAAVATTVAGAAETAATDSTTTPPGTEVLGISETAPDTLARTGAGLGILALAGGFALGGGRLLALLRRRLGS